MLHFTFQNMRAFYGRWLRGLGLRKSCTHTCSLPRQPPPPWSRGWPGATASPSPPTAPSPSSSCPSSSLLARGPPHFNPPQLSEGGVRVWIVAITEIIRGVGHCLITRRWRLRKGYRRGEERWYNFRFCVYRMCKEREGSQCTTVKENIF